MLSSALLEAHTSLEVRVLLGGRDHSKARGHHSGMRLGDDCWVCHKQHPKFHHTCKEASLCSKSTPTVPASSWLPLSPQLAGCSPNSTLPKKLKGPHISPWDGGGCWKQASLTLERLPEGPPVEGGYFWRGATGSAFSDTLSWGQTPVMATGPTCNLGSGQR